MSTNGADPRWPFDRELEEELRQRIGSVEGPSPEVSQSAYQSYWERRQRRSRGSALRSIFSRRLLLSLAVGTLLGLTGSVASMASGGSGSPVVLGRMITTTVQECKGELVGGQQGVAECVKEVATQTWRGRPTDARQGASSAVTGGEPNQAGPAGFLSAPAAASPPRSDGEARGEDRASGDGGRGQSPSQGPTATGPESPPGQARSPVKAAPGQDKSQEKGQGQGQAKSSGHASSPGQSKPPAQDSSHANNGQGAGQGKGGSGGDSSSRSQKPAPAPSPTPHR